MYYIIYKTTNLVNGKIYIGCHTTKNIDDEYLGSGKILKRAIKKYGIENFSREILEEFDNPNDMFDMEAQLVNEKFVTDNSNYNLKVGGEGGFSFINNNKLNLNGKFHENNKRQKKGRERQKWLFENDTEYHERYSKKRSELAKANDKFYKRMTGKKHNEETKKKMSEAKKGKYEGNNNSQYGTCWIHSLTEKINKKIKLSELNSYIDNGWIRGRKMKF